MGPEQHEIQPSRLAAAAMRAKVQMLEDKIREIEGHCTELPVRHYFAPGLYAREIHIPKDCVLTGKIHKYPQINILSQGDISVLTEEGIKRVQAPFTVVSPAGTKRVAYAHTDCVWTTIHPTNETDLTKIEAHFIAQDDAEYLAFCAAPKAVEQTKCPG